MQLCYRVLVQNNPEDAETLLLEIVLLHISI